MFGSCSAISHFGKRFHEKFIVECGVSERRSDGSEDPTKDAWQAVKVINTASVVQADLLLQELESLEFGDQHLEENES